MLGWMAQKGLLDFTVLGGVFKEQTENYLEENNLRIDYKGKWHYYDLVFTCSDLVIPSSIKDKKIVLVQEGMTDPENFMYYLVKWFGLPRYLASTSTSGLSDEYDKFCVASQGYKDLFIRKGVKAAKIAVTGIPNFDNLKQYLDNDFPYRNYVLVATSDARETYKFENRTKFLKKAVEIAGYKKLIFKLHPNENFDRAKKEIEKYAPGSIVYTEGNINEMIANCDILITQYSTVVYTGIVLGKKVFSYFDYGELVKQVPLQNSGTSAEKIAAVGRELVERSMMEIENEEVELINA
jgi:hypothetical protein